MNILTLPQTFQSIAQERKALFGEDEPPQKTTNDVLIKCVMTEMREGTKPTDIIVVIDKQNFSRLLVMVICVFLRKSRLEISGLKPFDGNEVKSGMHIERRAVSHLLLRKEQVELCGCHGLRWLVRKAVLSVSVISVVSAEVIR